MTTLPAIDTTCFVCGNPRTLTLFICDYCFESTYVTIHPLWLDPAYLTKMQDAAERDEHRNAQQAASRAAARAERNAA